MIKMIIIAFGISIFFIIMIYIIVKAYIKDIVEIENRMLQLEKRFNDYVKKDDYEQTIDFMIDSDTQQDILIKNLDKRIYKLEISGKEGEDKMACKKGRGGKKK